MCAYIYTHSFADMPYVYAEEHIWRTICIHIFVLTKQTYVYAKEPCTYAKILISTHTIHAEPYEPYVYAKVHIWQAIRVRKRALNI